MSELHNRVREAVEEAFKDLSGEPWWAGTIYVNKVCAALEGVLTDLDNAAAGEVQLRAQFQDYFDQIQHLFGKATDDDFVCVVCGVVGDHTVECPAAILAASSSPVAREAAGPMPEEKTT